MSNNDTRKPREFWIFLTGFSSGEDASEAAVYDKPSPEFDYHVIEYGAYEKLEKDKASNDADYLKLSAEAGALRKERNRYLESREAWKKTCKDLEKERDTLSQMLNEENDHYEDMRIERDDYRAALEEFAKQPKYYGPVAGEVLAKFAKSNKDSSESDPKESK